MDLLAGYIHAQTYAGALTWIIVDDCHPVTSIPPVRKGIMTVIVDPPWLWEPGMNTQAQSMAAALAHVAPGDTCIIMEDDDCYLPDHISNVLSALESADLVGERVARYYNVATSRYKVIPGNFHASLASTAVKGEALAKLIEVCQRGSRRIDMDLWREFDGSKALLDTGNVIGIKGMPGRGGIGVGHRDNFGHLDIAGDILRQWAGDVAANYGKDILCTG